MSENDERQPLSWKMLATMTQEQYEARRSEIQRWLLDHPPQRKPSLPEMISRLAEKYSCLRPERTQGTSVKPRPRWHILWDRHSKT